MRGGGREVGAGGGTTSFRKEPEGWETGYSSPNLFHCQAATPLNSPLSQL